MARNAKNPARRIFLLNRRNGMVFGLCLIMSFILWLLLAFNGTYTSTIRVPVLFENMPEQHLMPNALPEHVELQISGTGYQLLSYWIRSEKAALLLDGSMIRSMMKKDQYQFFITTRSGLDLFNRTHVDITALHCHPDTLFLDFIQKTKKTVPVRVVSFLKFDPGYGLADSIRVTPDSVSLTGPHELLERIHLVETKPLVLQKLDRSVQSPIELQVPAGVQADPAVVLAGLNIDQYTEARIDLPVKVPEAFRDSIRLYPSNMVSLVYEVPLKYYHQVKAEDFELRLILKNLRGNPGSRMQVELIRHPSYLRKLRLKPESLEYQLRNP
jgi:hypothetical protein